HFSFFIIIFPSSFVLRPFLGRAGFPNPQFHPTPSGLFRGPLRSRTSLHFAKEISFHIGSSTA
ncbi:MAG TPA: hypothetical protein PLM70_10170, partial [Bacteroidales bacterium]|nr:hypothetical protein [Bacteroidales bacterium]